MISEVTTTCAPMSSLFVSLLSCFCFASPCSQLAGKSHHRQPGQSRLPLPLERSIFTEHRLLSRQPLPNGSSKCFQTQVKCRGHCISTVGSSPLIITRATHLSWHRCKR